VALEGVFGKEAAEELLGGALVGHEGPDPIRYRRVEAWRQGGRDGL
jgi:hypothetical protein